MNKGLMNAIFNMQKECENYGVEVKRLKLYADCEAGDIEDLVKYADILEAKCYPQTVVDKIKDKFGKFQRPDIQKVADVLLTMNNFSISAAGAMMDYQTADRDKITKFVISKARRVASGYESGNNEEEYQKLVEEVYEFGSKVDENNLHRIQNVLSHFCRLDLPMSDHYLAEFLRDHVDSDMLDIQDGIAVLSKYGSKDYAQVILSPANNREVLGEIVAETDEPIIG